MVDSHCHLAGEEYVSDLPEVVARATAAGVTAGLCILAAEDAAESARAGEVRREWPAVRFAAGIHPHQAGGFAGRVAEAIAVVRRAVAAQGACAIGEIGLDYHYDLSPRAVQLELFRAQVRLARELRLPIVIHARDASDDTFRVLADEGRGEVRGVFHCFTGDADMARAALDAGFHLSFAGILTFPRAESIREAARLVPANRLLAETDSPYLAPVPHRGKRNEPAHVVHVFETLARIRNTDPAALGAAVSATFAALFGPAAV